MVTKALSKPAKINRLQIMDFMGIGRQDIRADGQHIHISGRNGAGKTSIAKAIKVVVCGATARELPQPIRNGADEALIEIDLGEFMMRRHWHDDGSMTFVVTDPNGKKVPQAAAFAKSLWDDKTHRPLAFIEARPQDQIDDVQDLLKIQPPVNRVQEILGDEFDEEMKPRAQETAHRWLMRISGDDTGVCYQRRRQAHQELERKRAAQVERRLTLESLGGPIRDAEEAPTAAALVQEGNELAQQKAERVKRQHELNHANDELAVAKRDMARLVRERDDAVRENDRWLTETDERIAMLDRQLNQAKADRVRAVQTWKERVQKFDERIADGKENYIPLLEANVEQAKQAAEGMPDPAPRQAELDKRIASIDQLTKAFSKRRVLHEECQRGAVEEEDAKERHKFLDDAMALLRHVRQHLMDYCESGIENLDFADGELLYKGAPFSQASTAERLEIWFQLALRRKPLLAFIIVDDAEHLDAEHKDLLIRLADSRGIQVIFLEVADEPEIVIEFTPIGEAA